MEIKLDADAMAALASKAIFEEMGQEQRDKVVLQAVQALLIPESNRNSFHVGKTPMQVAFDIAIQQAAQKAVQERVANSPEIAAKIDELLGPVLQGALKASAEKYDYGLSEAIGHAVGNWLADKARGD